MISDPGVYDMKDAEYHADPCPAPSLSSSIAKILLTKTPAHAAHAHPRLNPAFEREDATKFDVGSVAHDYTLRGEREFVVVEANDWRTKAAKEARAAALAEGVQPILEPQMEEVRKMWDALSEQYTFPPGLPERTLVWQEDDIWLRCKIDWLPGDAKLPADEFKTTTDASPEVWEPQVFRMGYDVQAAFYLRGLERLGHARPAFIWIVQETSAPYLVSQAALSPAGIHMAERKVAEAISIWRRCMQSSEWPGYPKQVAVITPPAWHETKWLEREERGYDAAVASQDDLRKAMESQAP